MLIHNNVLTFINNHLFDTIVAYNYFYKSLDGSYIDADKRTAYIAGVELREITDKKDVDLQWSSYSEHYRHNDELALSQAQSILKIEPTLNNKQQHVPVLSFKKAVVDVQGNPTGVFGTVFYIEEMSSAELVHGLNFLLNSLGTTPIAVPSQPANATSILQNLTPREKECARLLCLGMSAREIAHELHLSARTVESYLAIIKNKLGVTRKSELIRKITGTPQALIQW